MRKPITSPTFPARASQESAGLLPWISFWATASCQSGMTCRKLSADLVGFALVQWNDRTRGIWQSRFSNSLWGLFRQAQQGCRRFTSFQRWELELDVTEEARPVAPVLT